MSNIFDINVQSCKLTCQTLAQMENNMLTFALMFLLQKVLLVATHPNYLDHHLLSSTRCFGVFDLIAHKDHCSVGDMLR